MTDRNNLEIRQKNYKIGERSPSTKSKCPIRICFKKDKDTLDETLSIDFTNATYVGNNYEKIQRSINEITGVDEQELAIEIIQKVMDALPAHKNDRKNAYTAAVQALHLESPRDNTEAELISQKIALHAQAMNFLRRSHTTDRVDFSNNYINCATKLLRIYHETVNTLEKYRGRNNQSIRVEHVHVNSGGQAIVGNMNTGGVHKNGGTTS